MPCLLVLLALCLPRVALVLIFLFTTWIQAAFHTWLWPVLGFLFLPYTTLAWMGAMLMNGGQVSGGWLILVIIAVILDLGTHGSATRRRRAIV